MGETINLMGESARMSMLECISITLSIVALVVQGRMLINRTIQNGATEGRLLKFLRGGIDWLNL